MRTIDAAMVREAEDFVMNLLAHRLPEKYRFHSVFHTRNVTRNAGIIGLKCGLDEHQMDLVTISALFHDTGYIESNEFHENESSLIALDFLSARQVVARDRKQVLHAIMATKVPQMPVDLVSEVLCDADLMHLTSDDYFEQMELLRLEWKLTGRYDLTEYQFHLNSIEFFKAHQYHSPYGKSVMTARKVDVLNRILQKIEDLK